MPSLVEVPVVVIPLSTVTVEDGAGELFPVDTVPRDEVPDEDVPVDIGPGDEVPDGDVTAENASVEYVDGVLFAIEEMVVETVVLCISTVDE